MTEVSLEKKFELAVQYIKEGWVTPHLGKKEAPNDVKLKLYGFFKQTKFGDNTTPKPSFYKLEAKAKWNAWNAVKGMKKEEAMQNYIDEVEKFAPKWFEFEKVQAVLKE